MRSSIKFTLPDRVRQGLALVLGGCFVLQQTMQAAQTAASVPLLSGGTYVAGSGSIKSSGNAVTINQSSLRGIIDWSNFSIGPSGTVTFRNGNGATLNRVTGGQMSSILGSLFASGSVYLINPQGVLIWPGAHVNTGGDFTASTLNISSDVFMKGGSLLLQGDS